jgi:Dolichyl-phosphate-mannose-protein mannosyltransferase
MQKIFSSSINRLIRAFAGLFETCGCFQPTRPWEATAVITLVAVGAILRFWGLGSWGLEGDEKTMALPTMHLVHFGAPLMPSGMFYPRAIGQLYMMAASVRLFGESEWAFRFPSVICGIALIGIAYFVGRRFLAPAWNIAFVACTALLPALIADSQEARMYIFLVTCLAGYTALIFKWERSDRIVWLVAAVIVMLLGVQFHLLAVFGSFLLLFPGLLAANVRKLWQGGFGFLVVVVGFAGVSRWMENFYTPAVKADPRHVAAAETHISSLSLSHQSPVLLLAGVIAAALLAVYVARSVNVRTSAIAVAVLLFAGLLCELALFYHVGVVLILCGAILAQRNAGKALPRIAVLLALSLVLAVSQFSFLHHASGESLRKTLGMMVGLPGIWSYLRAAMYSPAAWLIVCLAVLHALWQLAQRRRLPDYWLFFILAVWLPVFALGLFTWDVEARYTEFALLPLLVCALAASQEVSAVIARRLSPTVVPVVQGVMAAVAVILIVNPISLAHAVNAGYSIHPDHKGAAEFIRSIRPRPDDVIIAEDSLQQTYYLGHIDYWLRGMNDAGEFVYRKGGVLRDIYTDAPLIGSGAELMALVDRRDRGAIYVIGTAEFKGDDLRLMRGGGIYEALQRPIFAPVFLGRDGLTQVWKVRAPTDAPGAADRRD